MTDARQDDNSELREAAQVNFLHQTKYTSELVEREKKWRQHSSKKKRKILYLTDKISFVSIKYIILYTLHNGLTIYISPLLAIKTTELTP